MVAKVFTLNRPTFLFCIEELKELVDSKFGSFNFLIFAVHPTYPTKSINHIIKKIFKTDKFIAFHAVNAFNDNQITGASVSVCCFKFENRGKIDTFYIEDIRNFKSDDTLDKTADYFNKKKDRFHIIVSGLCDGEIGYFIKELSERLDYAPIDNIIGGISSGIPKDDRVETFQFIDDKIIKNGFVVVSFSNVEYAMDISLGFKPYGITYKIAKSKGANLYSVDDGKSFPYLLNKIVSNLEDKDIRNLWYMPIYILDDKDGRVSTLRTPAKIEKDCVKFFAPLKEGENFKLSFATYKELLKEDEKIAKRLIKDIPEPEISFNFSCVARQYVLEDKQEKEIETYTKNFNTHLFGFFTFGEIGPNVSYTKLKLYNETSLVALLKEK